MPCAAQNIALRVGRCTCLQVYRTYDLPWHYSVGSTLRSPEHQSEGKIMHAVPRTLQKLPNAVPKDAVRHMSSCRGWAYGVGLESLQSSLVATDVTVCACRSLGHMTLNGITDIKIGANYAVHITEAARAMLHNGHCQHRILLQSSRHVFLNKRACKVTSL